MKKTVILILLLAIIYQLFGCATPKDDGRINIVCTLFPQYDWVKNIVGDSKNITVSLLIQNGTDPHSYQPTASDIMTLSSCDMVVLIGSDSDVWVQEALERAKNESTVKVALSQIEGMTLHDVSASSHEHGHEQHEHEHSTFDEHIWLSISNAITATEYLTQEICALDSENAQKYQENSTSYQKKLHELDNKYQSAVNSTDISSRFILFADRFPFVYLLEDYKIEYAAAFEGCTTDVDADFNTVLELIKEAEEHRVRYVTVTEASNQELAYTVATSAKAKLEILVMNSLQSVNQKQLDEGISYLSVMENNLSVLSKALSVKGE